MDLRLPAMLAIFFLLLGCSGTNTAAGQINASVPDHINASVSDINTTGSSQVHQICHGSVCCRGVGDQCGTFACANNIYSRPGGMDSAGAYINGSDGEVIARCGGNIMPLHPELCDSLGRTCDYSKPAENVPDTIQTG